MIAVIAHPRSVRLITSATRLAVQTSPRNPYASAPLANKAGICAFCSAVNRGLTPLGGCALRASSPPSRPRLIQWLTAPSLTPKAAAMSFCCQPSSSSFHARFRRSSRQSADLLVLPCPLLYHTCLPSADVSKLYIQGTKRDLQQAVETIAWV